jgi:hypothetical protein
MTPCTGWDAEPASPSDAGSSGTLSEESALGGSTGVADGLPAEQEASTDQVASEVDDSGAGADASPADSAQTSEVDQSGAESEGEVGGSDHHVSTSECL